MMPASCAAATCAMIGSAPRGANGPARHAARELNLTLQSLGELP
jgi:hypothetical protein